MISDYYPFDYLLNIWEEWTARMWWSVGGFIMSTVMCVEENLMIVITWFDFIF